MKEQLDLLAKIQLIDTSIIGLSKKEDLFQSEIEKNEAGILNAEQQYNDEKEKLDLLEKEHREHERDLKTFEEQKKKIEDKLLSIKTNKEYQASLLEIENIKNQISRKEDAIIESMDRLEASRKEVKKTEENLKKIKDEFAGEKTKMQQEHEQYLTDIESKKKERDELVSKVDPKLFENYRKITKAKNGVGIAFVENEQCMGCFMKIPPQIYNEVVMGLGMRICPHCQRILHGGGD